MYQVAYSLHLNFDGVMVSYLGITLVQLRVACMLGYYYVDLDYVPYLVCILGFI